METQIVSTDTLIQATSVVGKVIPLFVWIVGGMAVAIVAMAAYVVVQQKVIIKLQKESTVAITKNNLLIENNTKTHDRLLEYFVKKGK